ncbi:hypothetical protein [Qipengyuania gaetbuli]|uniref:hypothetical protein n=1 Tax=Qipengyuania gaetbuli TaxID=266952 RepID=UPI001CFDA793|nr:hypothetical protein [Qipengyuania gaetbuli]
MKFIEYILSQERVLVCRAVPKITQAGAELLSSPFCDKHLGRSIRSAMLCVPFTQQFAMLAAMHHLG